MTQAVFSPSAACASWLRLGTFPQVVWEKHSCHVQELEYEAYASCQASTGYKLKASQKQNGFKNDWKDSFSLTDGKYQRLGKCAHVSMHICICVCVHTHACTNAFGEEAVNKTWKLSEKFRTSLLLHCVFSEIYFLKWIITTIIFLCTSVVEE